MCSNILFQLSDKTNIQRRHYRTIKNISISRDKLPSLFLYGLPRRTNIVSQTLKVCFSLKGMCAFVVRWFANGLHFVLIFQKETAFYPIWSIGKYSGVPDLIKFFLFEKLVQKGGHLQTTSLYTRIFPVTVWWRILTDCTRYDNKIINFDQIPQCYLQDNLSI